MCYTKIKHILMQLAFTSERDIHVQKFIYYYKKNIFFYNI